MRGIPQIVFGGLGRADGALRAGGHVRGPRRLGGRGAVVRGARGALSRRPAGVAGALPARGGDAASWRARQRGGAVPGGVATPAPPRTAARFWPGTAPPVRGGTAAPAAAAGAR